MGLDNNGQDVITTRFDERPLRDQTMNSVLENRASQLGEKPFIRYGSEERDVSFAELNETANAIGNSLLELGIGRQTKVAVMMRDPLRTLFGMFGIHKAGGVYCPINFEYKGNALLYQINDTSPSVLIVEDRYLGRLNEVSDELETLPHVVVYETDAESDELDAAFERSSFQAMVENDTTAPDVTATWSDEASVVYTSGTTGKPKGVVLPHRWIFANYTKTTGRLLGTEDVVHTALPLYHVGGVYADITSALITGASVGLWDRFSPNDFWDRIEKYGATRVVLLSVMIPWLMKQPERDDDHRNTLKLVHMQPLPENYDEIAERFGFDFVTAGFGQTESGGPLSGIVHTAKGDEGTPADLLRGTPPEEIYERAEQLGVPVVDEVPGERYMGQPSSDTIEAAILNEQDERLPPGEVGELAFRPKLPGLLMKEYYGKPEKTVEAFRNLWFHTGDAAYRDEAGNYYFVDRMGDVIRRRGENISSIQIQDVVNSHEAVAQAAVVPVPAEEGGEDEIGAAVEPVEGETVTESMLRDHLGERLPEFMHPDHVVVVDEMPTTETNKMEKYEVRRRLFDEK